MSNNPTFSIGAGNTAPPVSAILLLGSGALAALTGATVTFSLYSLGGTVIFTRSATVVSVPLASVRYSWLAGDTTTRGSYLGRFRVTYADTTVQDFPNDRFIEIAVT